MSSPADHSSARAWLVSPASFEVSEAIVDTSSKSTAERACPSRPLPGPIWARTIRTFSSFAAMPAAVWTAWAKRTGSRNCRPQKEVSTNSVVTTEPVTVLTTGHQGFPGRNVGSRSFSIATPGSSNGECMAAPTSRALAAMPSSRSLAAMVSRSLRSPETTQASVPL